MDAPSSCSNGFTDSLYAGIDTLSQVIAPMSSYVDDFGCHADFNSSGHLELQDVFDYLDAWFNGERGADFNKSGSLELQDIFAFLSAWFAGC